MRIQEIAVKSLFGIFNHVVPMHLDERITIVHGPNGFGKTTLLKLVENFFGGRYSDLRKTPYASIRITFEDGGVLTVVRREPPKSRARSSATLDMTFEKDKDQLTATLRGASPESVPLHLVDSIVPWLRRESEFTWRDTRTGEPLGLDELVRHYTPRFPSGFFQGDRPADEEPEWLTTLRKGFSVRFIESQRLLRIGKNRERHESEETYRPSVNVYSKELAVHIQRKLAEYGVLSQSLDRSFPRRLVEQRSEPSGKLSVDELTTKLQDLEDKRRRLTDAGLLDKSEEEFDFRRDAIDATLTSSVLPVYARDMELKLAVFDDLAQRIEILQSIVKSRFLYKEMTLNKEQGFVFTTPASKPLAPTYLSSGEQHMLVLLYELLFKVKRNSLIMIDEPEISLHVAWQLEFLRDLKRITDLSSIDVLMATHAPGIINDRWDLTAELKAPSGLK